MTNSAGLPTTLLPRDLHHASVRDRHTRPPSVASSEARKSFGKSRDQECVGPGTAPLGRGEVGPLFVHGVVAM